MRLLLIEDDAMIGEAVREVLRDVAYAADWVQDGETALACLEAQSYDLILLDLGLPDMDGMAAIFL